MTAHTSRDDLTRRMHRDAVSLTAELIRIDSSNTGDPSTMGDGESQCAERIRHSLAEVGIHGGWYERTPGRGNVVFRISGTDPVRPALLMHAHTDVVPADPDDWSVDPFAGEIRDGELWGRGAVDMKNMIGMLIAAVRALALEGWHPRRDIVLACVADEEMEGADGMAFLVEQHPELFDGVTEAIGEVGGFSLEMPSGRHYALGIGEQAVAWATLRSTGVEGHGSLVSNTDNAIAQITQALARIATHEWPLADDNTTRTVLTHLSSALGEDVVVQHAEQQLSQLGPIAPMLTSALRTSSALTQVHAGSTTNTVPGTAMATVDCRVAPGFETEFHRVFHNLVGPGIAVTWEIGPSVTAPFGTTLTADIAQAISVIDPGAGVLPFITGGATDAKALSRLGIDCYGFVPLRLAATFDLPGMFHGIDERVPVSALESGAEVLRELLRSQ